MWTIAALIMISLTRLLGFTQRKEIVFSPFAIG
jgi:hypothetical protein